VEKTKLVKVGNSKLVVLYAPNNILEVVKGVFTNQNYRPGPNNNGSNELEAVRRISAGKKGGFCCSVSEKGGHILINLYKGKLANGRNIIDQKDESVKKEMNRMRGIIAKKLNFNSSNIKTMEERELSKYIRG
jgi:hypothetical protein